jgi:hypothetical protein
LVQTLDFRDFQIKTPANWKKLTMRGYDSYVGGLTNNRDTLEFDFGPYSNDLIHDGACEIELYADDTINGKAGYIAKPKIKEKGFVGVYFGDIDGDKFNLYTHRNPKAEDTIIAIFRHIRFKTSDTTHNTPTLKFVARQCN